MILKPRHVRKAGRYLQKINSDHWKHNDPENYKAHQQELREARQEFKSLREGIGGANSQAAKDDWVVRWFGQGAAYYLRRRR